MKIKVALCDDVELLLNLIEQQLLQIAHDRNIELEIHKYQQSKQLLNVFHSRFETYDIVFLDINMPDVDGFALAKAIKEVDEHTLIIFLSSHEHLVFQSFEYQPFRFIRKLQLHDELPQALLDAIDNIQKHPGDLLYFKTTEGIVKLPAETILYIEACGHKSCIFTIKGEYFITKTMKDLESELKDFGFIRIHNGNIVNTHHVKKLAKLNLELTNGTILAVSRYRLQEVKNSIMI